MATDSPSDAPHFQGFQFPTTTPVPDEVFDVLMDHLTGAELKVVLYICRRTFGFKKTSDNISLNQMIHGITTKEGKVLDRGTGLSRDSVARVIKSLVAKGVIVRDKRQSLEKGNEASTYSLNFLNGDGTPQSDNRTRGGGKIGLGLVRLSDSQQTVLQETEGQQDVVVRQALQNFGISKPAAAKLTKDYPEELVSEKLGLAQWLVSIGSPAIAKNPAGWLRKAIEEDYIPPRNYESPSEKKSKTEQAAKIAEQEAKERRLLEEEFRRVRTETKEQLLEQFPAEPVGEGLSTHTAWELALQKLQDQVGVANYETWLKDTVLLNVTDRAAEISVGSPYIGAWIERRLYREIAGTLKEVLKKDLDLKFLTVTSPGNG